MLINGVENIQVVPKLKYSSMENDFGPALSVWRQSEDIFQYGKELFQTTTSDQVMLKMAYVKVSVVC